ncbi:MAG TPA: DnaJ domain-containing protein [bacterium]|nr:DnaJ domain-containing protein [bacterium]
MNNSADKFSLPPNAVPLVCEGDDLLAQNVTPEEGFLISRLHGTLTVEALCSQTGLGKQKTLALLASLRKKGIISFHDHECAAPREDTAPAADAVEPDPASAPAARVFTLSELKKIIRKERPKGEQLVPVIEAIFENLEHLSYYDLLGISGKADQQQVKKAYLKATKSFHPDRFYRKADREFRRKLQEIFKQANKGYRALSDEEARKAYDASLGVVEEEPEEEVIEAAPLKARSRSVKGEPSPWKRIRVSKARPVEEKTRAPKRVEEPAKPKGPMLKLGFGEASKPVSALLQKMEKAKQESQGAYLDQAEKFYKGAMIEKERRNLNAAKINLKLALEYSRGNPKYKEALAELEKREGAQKGEQEFKRGLDAQAEGDLRSAAMHYKEALRAGFENAKLLQRLAELVMELDNNFERARGLVLKAIEMEPGIVDYHMTLARAYKGLNQKAAAIVQLEKVLKIEPKNKLAAKEIKALKRG